MKLGKQAQNIGIAALVGFVGVDFFLSLSLRNEVTRLRTSIDQQNISGQLTQQPTEQVARLDSITQSLASIREDLDRHLENQSAILDRTIGKYVPLQLPPSTDQNLKQLEVRIADPTAWPKDTNEYQAMDDQLVSLMKGVPPWAEEDLLPRLNKVRWSVQAIALITTGKSVAEGRLDDAVSQCNSLLEGKPETAPDVIVSQLSSTSVELQRRQHESQKAVALKSASSAVARSDTNEMSKALNLLDAVGGDDPDIAAARKQLATGLLDSEVTQLRTRLQNCAAIRDEPLKRLGVLKVYEAAMDDELNLLIRGDTPELTISNAADVVQDSQALLKQYAGEQQQKQANQLREYQRWALFQIKTFKTTFDAIQQVCDAEDAKHWPGLKPGWQDTHYKELCDAMLTDLLPINTNLLEQPVAVSYSQAYDQAWAKLRDQDKVDLTVRTADVVKVIPNDDK